MAGGKKRGRQEKGKPANGPKGGKKKTQSNTSTDLNSLISNLAKQQASDSTAKTTSKEERIQKRAAKKQRRDDRKGYVENTSSDNIKNPTEDRKPPPPRPPQPNEERPTRPHATTATNKKRLRQLATACKELVPKSKFYQKPFEGLDKKKRKTKQLDDVNVQPRPKDYGGLGLARETLFLPLQDPSFTRRLEEEFQEHVDGFFGKQRTKAMKKQLDGKMLWRQLQNKQNKDKKVDGKSLASMTPDERVEAMLKAGML